MKKSRVNEVPVHEFSEHLRQVYYCLGRGKRPLHKLVPSGYLGSPGYSEDGTFISGDEGKHLSVVCGVAYDVYATNWQCYITVTDGDDLIYTYRRPFTMEEWKKTLVLYNSLYMIDHELLTEFFS